MKLAVEWLEEQVIKFHNWKLNPVFDENCFDEIELRKAIQQAKEMEKEQREKDFIAGYKKRAELSNLIFDEASELTAKELFKQQEQ